MNAAQVLTAIEAVRAVPVIRSPSSAEAIDLATELVAGGLNVVEATFTTPDAETVIRRLSEQPGVVVGAGTVLTPEQARSAVRAGAEFLVSPLWLPWLVDLAAELGVVAVPGASTPTEIWQAWDAGAPVVKVFPIARLGGAAYVKDLLAPLPQVKLMATGGVDLPMARELLAAGCVAVGLGSVHRDATLGDSVRERAAGAVSGLTKLPT